MQASTKLKIYIGAVLMAVLMFAGMYFAYRYLHRNDPLCKNCNVVVVDIDVLRADELPCYGYARNTAPALCAFANQSSLFKHNYSQANLTLPSIFSTITSLNPWAHGIMLLLAGPLSPGVATMAELFRANGYHTAFVGTLSPATIDNEKGGSRGFDSVSSPDWTKALSELQKTKAPFFAYFYDDGSLHMPYMLEKDGDQIENLPKPKGLPITQRGFDAVLADYLQKNYKSIFTQKAIVQYADLFNNRGPEPNLELAHFFESQNNSPTQNEYLLQAYPAIYNTYMQFIDKNSPSDAAYLRMLYDTKIKELDRDLSGFFALLSSPGLAKNTVVVVISEHGEAFGEHGAFFHGNDPHTEQYYTPLIIRIPNQKPKIINTATSNIDVLPTVLNAVGISVPPQAQGGSLIPIIRGQIPLAPRYSLGEASGEETLTIRDEEWTFLLRQPAGEAPTHELYNRASDPKELKNLAGSPQYKNQEEKLFSLLQEIRNKTGLPHVIPAALPSWMDEKTIERLKREGYF